MEGNSFYHLLRRKSPRSDIGVVWTGDGWSEDTNDGVLFRHAGSAEKFAKSRKWDVRVPGAFHPNPMAVEVSLANPELVLREVRF